MKVILKSREDFIEEHGEHGALAYENSDANFGCEYTILNECDNGNMEIDVYNNGYPIHVVSSLYIRQLED